MNPDLIPIAAAVRVTDWREAERLARALLQSDDAREDLLTMLAISLHMQGRVGEAIDTYERLTRLFPERGEHWGNYATSLREAGRLAEAATAYEEALRLTPADAGQILNYALLLLEERKYAEARDHALKAYSLDRNSPHIRIGAAQICSACREDEEVLELLDGWQGWSLPDEEARLKLANLLLTIGNGNDAVALFEACARDSGGSTSSVLNLSAAYERVNRIKDAEQQLLALESRKLSSTEEYARRRIMAKLAKRTGDLPIARSILEELGPIHAGDFTHYFTLAEVYDKLGEIDLAMDALRTAHELQGSDVRQIIPKRFEPGAAPFPVALKRVTQAAFAKWQDTIAPSAAQSPVLIVGFPRSGTTLLEQMLDAHPRFQSMDERPFFSNLVDQLAEHDIRFPEDIEKLGQRDCDELRRRYIAMVCGALKRRWDTRIVDKNPLNMLWMPLIHRMFPEARYILALRHPCDVILSCYMQNFRTNMLAAASTDLTKLAVAYVDSMTNWLHHADLLRPHVLEVRYEDTVTDIRAQAEKISAFLEVDRAENLLGFAEHAKNKGFIGTPSYTEVIKPVSTRALGRWRKYKQHLEPALSILEPMIAHWGYEA
ncbi:tetratricopeptide repeat-containing sulfotransferase family protein [Dokdonella fugitiva]|nr:tetratricopeptide repeat-containing sulfotransferase family protein [Dokdonella fugitiva]